MRIVQVAESLDFGGAERVVVDLSNALARNHDVGVICVKRVGELASQLSPDVAVKCLDKAEGLDFALPRRMAKLLRENEFATQFHEGEKANIHIQLVDNRVILVVIFDKKTSLGLVRLRVKKASEQLGTIFKALAAKSSGPEKAMFAEITDDDIDNLFNE